MMCCDWRKQDEEKDCKPAQAQNQHCFLGTNSWPFDHDTNEDGALFSHIFVVVFLSNYLYSLEGGLCVTVRIHCFFGVPVFVLLRSTYSVQN